MLVFDKYVKYVAYAKLYKEFNNIINGLDVERPAVHTLQKCVVKSYRNLESEASDQISIKVSDSLDAIAHKQEQYRYTIDYTQYLKQAKNEFIEALDTLNRPSVRIAHKCLNKVIELVKADLLYV